MVFQVLLTVELSMQVVRTFVSLNFVYKIKNLSISDKNIFDKTVQLADVPKKARNLSFVIFNK